MGDAGFFKGTSADQDARFSDKQKKLLRSMNFPPEFNQKIDMKKVNLKVIKGWMAQRVSQLLGIEDEVVVEYAFGMLEEPSPDPKTMQINLQGFLDKNSQVFVLELWKLLISAQNSLGGIPQQFLDHTKEELLQRKRDKEAELAKVREQEEKDRAVVEQVKRKAQEIRESTRPHALAIGNGGSTDARTTLRDRPHEGRHSRDYQERIRRDRSRSEERYDSRRRNGGRHESRRQDRYQDRGRDHRESYRQDDRHRSSRRRTRSRTRSHSRGRGRDHSRSRSRDRVRDFSRDRSRESRKEYSRRDRSKDRGRERGRTHGRHHDDSPSSKRRRMRSVSRSRSASRSRSDDRSRTKATYSTRSRSRTPPAQSKSTNGADNKDSQAPKSEESGTDGKPKESVDTVALENQLREKLLRERVLQSVKNKNATQES